jgi:predicted metal-binding membrane protein
MTPAATTLEGLLRRDRMIVASGLALLVLLAWGYLLAGAGIGMSSIAMSTWQFPPPAPAMRMARAWDAGYWFVMLAMWWVMMIAMMTPSAAPMVLLYARVTRHAQARGTMPAGPVPTGIFVSGYLFAWLGFSSAACVAQWALEASGLIDGMMMWSTAKGLTGGLLVAAGLYQLTPLKAACLQHCRAPAEYLSTHWQPRQLGALRMGLVHGAYCVGCCWMLMLLLFAGGIMNLVWIAGLAAVVLAEKILPCGQLIGRLLAVLMIGTGSVVLVT